VKALLKEKGVMTLPKDAVVHSLRHTHYADCGPFQRRGEPAIRSSVAGVLGACFRAFGSDEPAGRRKCTGADDFAGSPYKAPYTSCASVR